MKNWRCHRHDRGWTFYGFDEKGAIRASISFVYMSASQGAAFVRNNRKSNAYVFHKYHRDGMDPGTTVAEHSQSVWNRNEGDKWARAIAREIRKSL